MPTPPTGRFEIAFGADTLNPDPTAWTALDQDHPSLVAEYAIDRGRSFELDRVDTGRATIVINDTDGLLDPTNAGSPYAGKIQPLKQARLAIWNPVLEDWYTRFRGFVESFEYEFDPSQLVNRVTISLVDIFEIVSAVEMFPGYFGDPAPASDIVFFEDTLDGDVHGMQRRVNDVLRDAPLGSCGIPAGWSVVFSGNVSLHEARYSAGESAMAPIQEACDAEFPAVSNVYGDRLGRLAVHGRYARFDPEDTAAATPGWDFHSWKAGDKAAVAASPTDTAHIRAFSMSRDLGKIINHALATPVTAKTAPDFFGQSVVDTVSKGKYGLRTWSTQNLLTKEGVTDGFVLPPGHPPGDESASWPETKTFADYYVRNYKNPQTRVSSITFRSIHPASPGAAANWALLSECDINDRVVITIGSPGGGGLVAVPFFVEGIHEQFRPASGDLDDVTLTLDLSPASYYDDNPYA